MKSIFKRLGQIAISYISLLVATYLLLATAYAGSGLVSSIGSVAFPQGTRHFWVTTARPAFGGVTTAGGSVDITIGSTKNGVKADASGNWSWTPTADLFGDNQITVASSTTSIAFTLTIGALPQSIASASGSTLSAAGSTLPTAVLITGGLCLVLFGAWGLRKNFKPQY